MDSLPAYPPEPGFELSSVRPRVSYEVMGELGKGGRGIAFKVTVRGGDRDGLICVVKLPRLDITKFSLDDIRRRVAEGNDAIHDEMEALRELEEKDGVAPILEVAGQAWHCIKDGRQESITFFHTVYPYIEGLDLDDWCEKHHAGAQGKFEGIADPAAWFSLARQLFEILDRVHYQRVVHGDIWPPNIRMRPDGSAVIIDFGQAWSLERLFERRSDAYKTHEYLAPERYAVNGRKSRWYATADIYSMGGVLFFLATGEPPPSPWANVEGGPSKTNRVLKQEVAQAIRARNPRLFKANLGVIDVIMACLSPNLDYRARHAGVVLETINVFCDHPDLGEDRVAAIESAFHQVQDELAEFRKLPFASNPVVQKIILRRLHSLRDDLSPLRKRVFSIAGDREAHVNGVLDCISTLGAGDELVAVTSTRFWSRGNFGPYGRLSAMLTMAALRGARVRWVLLVNDQLLLEDRDVLDYQRRTVLDYLECSGLGSDSYGADSNLFISYKAMPETDIEKVRRERDTGVLLRRGVDWTLIAPDYSDVSGAISIVRLWAAPTRRDHLLDAYAQHANSSVSIAQPPMQPYAP